MPAKDFNFDPREKILVSRIAENREHVLFVSDLCAKRIYHADAALFVRARQRMIAIASLKKLVNDDALVNDVDREIACSQTVTVES